MRKLILLIFLLAAFAAAQKSVRVRTYTRKDGTVVHFHTRSAPGAATKVTTGNTTSSSRNATHESKTTTTATPVATTTPPKRDAKGRIVRSATAKREFARSNPRPSTGKTTGACRGYVIDHVTPLACGGPDASSNMQWQTTATAKEKDKWERSGCAVGGGDRF